MGAKRVDEPFNRALSELRGRIREGRLGPGSRILTAEIASELRLSPTPVREALSRLAGEGVLEDRRGQGVFVRRLSRADIADLYRLSLAHLLIALEPGRDLRRLASAPEPATFADDPVAGVERLMAAWIAEAASPALLASFRRLQVQLGPVRRLEAGLIPDLAAEARELAAAWAGASRGVGLSRLRGFHLRRIGLAEALGEHLERAANADIDRI